MIRIAASGALLAASAACSGTEAREPGPALELTGRVTDSANILSSETEVNLDSKLAALQASTGVQLVVATTPTLQGNDIASYSLDLANAWGIGSVERDDGLLLLVAPNERRVRIEVGLGLEASVRDEEAALIIEESMLPHFRRSDFDRGVMKAVDDLVEEVTPVAMREAA